MRILTFIIFTCFAINVQAQDRFDDLAKQLSDLAKTDAPGLNQKVDVSVSGVSIQEYLRGVARTNDLNLSVDPNIKVVTTSSFVDETALNVLLFLCEEHDLTIEFTGSIMAIKPYEAPPETPAPYVPKNIEVAYDTTAKTLTLDLKKDSLLEVAKKITQLSSINISLAPGLADEQMTVYCLNLPFEIALDKLAFENGLAVKKEGDLYVLSKAPAKPVEAPAAATSSARNNRNTRGSSGSRSSSGSGNFDISISQAADGTLLISVDATNAPIAAILKEASRQAGIDHFLFAEPSGNVTVFLQSVDYDTFLTYLLQSTQLTFTKEGSLYLIGNRKAEGFRTTKLFQMQYRSADTVVALIPNELKKDVQLTTFPELNSVIASGSTHTIAEIDTFITAIDQVVPMVLIEVIVMDVNRSRLTEAGVSAGISSEPVQTQGTVFPAVDMTLGSDGINQVIGAINSTGLTNLGFVPANFYASLKLLEDQQAINLRSTPNLSTLNGHAANMRIGQTRYFRQTQTNVVGTQNPQTIVTEEFRETQADLSIDIRPVVSGDEHVTLDINVELSTFIGIPPANAPPPTATRLFNSMIRVKNEQMVVLGGLNEVEKSESGTGVPVLSRIPILKWLFSSRAKTNRKGELVVLIKPTILY